MRLRFWKSKCERKGHDWFPPIIQREYIPHPSQCLRCNAKHVELPYGECLNKHPLADHYRPDGSYRRHPLPNGCKGPM